MVDPIIRYAGDQKMRDLLRRYACPVPFHTVRTRFMGNIATPQLDASPARMIESFWGGALPEFEDTNAANDLFQGLLSLWNHLTKHQSRSRPFRLVREATAPSLDDLRRLCQTRTEEIEGFGVGLFGADDDEEIALPTRAIQGMARLDEIDAEILGFARVLNDSAQSPTEGEIAETLRQLKALTRTAETEIHAVLLACVRARLGARASHKTGSPTIH